MKFFSVRAENCFVKKINTVHFTIKKSMKKSPVQKL